MACKVNAGFGPDRRLLLIGEFQGRETPQEFEVTATGSVTITFGATRVVYDEAGDKLMELGPEEAYAAETDLRIDLSKKGEVSVHRGTTGELLNRYTLQQNEDQVYKVFFSDSGKICHAEIRGSKFISFDPLTGELLWEEESHYSWSLIGSGSLLVRYTYLFGIPENPLPSWPVEETLYDSRTGEQLFAEENESNESLVMPWGDGWLYRGKLAGSQTFYVTEQVQIFNTTGEFFASLMLEGGQVVRPWLSPSASGSSVVALVRFTRENGEAYYRVGVWKTDTENAVWIDWDNGWGDPSLLLDLTVADSGEFLVLSSASSGILKINTDTGISESLLEPVRASLAILGTDQFLLLEDEEDDLRFIEFETNEEVFIRSNSKGNQGARLDLKRWRILEDGTVFSLGVDDRVWRIDLTTLEAKVLAPIESPKVTAVWAESEEGLATVMYADGMSQKVDLKTGLAKGERVTAGPAHNSVLASDGKPRLVVYGDGRVIDLDTGEVRFNLSSAIDNTLLSEQEREIVTHLLASNSLRAMILESGRRIVFFDGERMAVFSLLVQSLIHAAEYPWIELVEGESFLVVREAVRGSGNKWEQRLAIYDPWTYQELYRLAIPGGVEVSIDGEYFAWLEEDLEGAYSGLGAYEWQYTLRQFEMERMGFHEIEALEWRQTFPAAEGPSYGMPELLSYQGPEGSTLALIGRSRILDMLTGTYAEWELPETRLGRGTEVVHETEEGNLLLRDELNRVGLYGYFVPNVASVDLILRNDGRAEPSLINVTAERVDVWYSSNLEDWSCWDGWPVLVEKGKPVFFRVIEWVPE